jgi:antitoxin ParD1/3/4
MGRNNTISISFTPHHEQLIRAKLAAGGYHSASEVVREAMRLLEATEAGNDEFWSDVRRKVAVARKQARDGKGIPGDRARAEMESYLKEKLRGPRSKRPSRRAGRA